VRETLWARPSPLLRGSSRSCSERIHVSGSLRIVRWIVACLGALPLNVVLAAPPPVVNIGRDDLSAKLNQYAGYPGAGKLTPGMIAAVVHGKHIVALGAAGYAKLPEMTPMTEDMIFNIGSNTKSMTATLLSILIEENPTLTWDTTLAEALPWATEP